MNGATPIAGDPSRFDVDWAALRSWRERWLGRPVIVDPLVVARAVCAVMRQCPSRGVRGRRLVWNEYSIFLHVDDWEHLRSLENTLTRELLGLVREELERLKAQTVGPLNVRLLNDEGGSVPRARGVIKGDFVELLTRQRDVGEMTVREVGRLSRPMAEEQTEGVGERPAGGSAAPTVATPGAGLDDVWITWPGGSVPLPRGTKVVLGRPHPSPTPNFVALTGAGQRINSRQVALEMAAAGVAITRLSEANPVEVNGRSLQPGGRILADELPIRIVLSSGALVLDVHRAGPS